MQNSGTIKSRAQSETVCILCFGFCVLKLGFPAGPEQGGNMDEFTIAFAVIFVLVMIFFLHQFRLLNARGIIFGIAAVALVLGFSLFQSYRKRKLQEELRRREEDLKKQEERLKELEKQYDAARDEIREAEEALKRERARYLKQILEIEAEKAENLHQRREQLNNMSPDELFEEYNKVIGGGN